MDKKNTLEIPHPETKRQANLELLRCVAMMMVVVLHYLGKGKLLPRENMFHPIGMTAWCLEYLCVVAVNLYMLLTGYFGWKSSFRLSKLLKMYFQLWIFSVVVGFACYALGFHPDEDSGVHFFLTLLLPVSMEHFWFMTAYFYLYILQPFLGKTLRGMTQRQMKTALLVLLAFYSILKSVLPVRLETDAEGYDFMWYLCMFVAGAYISRFGIKGMETGKKGTAIKGAVLYLAATMAMGAEHLALQTIYLKTGRFALVKDISMEYNHIFPMAASIGLFLVFLNLEIKGKIATVINRIAPCTLGVYLLHENVAIRYKWPFWLGAGKIKNALDLLLHTLLAVVIVFTAGIVADALRGRIITCVHGFLKKHLTFYRRITEKVEAVDEIWN